MKYESTKTVQSKIDPDVKFVIKKMNGRRRDRVSEIEAPHLAKMDELRTEEFKALNQEYEDAKKVAAESKEPLVFDSAKLDQWLAVATKLLRVDNYERMRDVCKFVVVRIEGLEIDGIAATVDSLFEAGPESTEDGGVDLYQELVEAVKREMGLLPDETKNSKSPLDSPAPESEKAAGSVDNAEKKDATTLVAA